MSETFRVTLDNMPVARIGDAWWDCRDDPPSRLPKSYFTDALDTRAALRELVLMAQLLGVIVEDEKSLSNTGREGARSVAARAYRLMCRLDAAAPPPPARTVTRAQYERALAVLLAYQTSRHAKLDQILTALDLRVADDDAEAT